MADCNAFKPGEIDFPPRCTQLPGHENFGEPHMAAARSVGSPGGTVHAPAVVWWGDA